MRARPGIGAVALWAQGRDEEFFFFAKTVSCALRPYGAEYNEFCWRLLVY